VGFPKATESREAALCRFPARVAATSPNDPDPDSRLTFSANETLANPFGRDDHDLHDTTSTILHYLDYKFGRQTIDI